MVACGWLPVITPTSPKKETQRLQNASKIGPGGSKNEPRGSQNGPASGPKSGFLHFWVIFVIALRKIVLAECPSPLLEAKPPKMVPKGSQNGPQRGQTWAKKGGEFQHDFLLIFLCFFGRNRDPKLLIFRWFLDENSNVLHIDKYWKMLITSWGNWCFWRLVLSWSH